MTHKVDRWDAEEWLQENKDIWNHPMVRDRTESNGYEVADLMAEFANYILSKQDDTRRKENIVDDLMTEFANNIITKQNDTRG
jgi:hypothetical protein